RPSSSTTCGPAASVHATLGRRRCAVRLSARRGRMSVVPSPRAVISERLPLAARGPRVDDSPRCAWTTCNAQRPTRSVAGRDQRASRVASCPPLRQPPRHVPCSIPGRRYQTMDQARSTLSIALFALLSAACVGAIGDALGGDDDANGGGGSGGG